MRSTGYGAIVSVNCRSASGSEPAEGLQRPGSVGGAMLGLGGEARRGEDESDDDRRKMNQRKVGTVVCGGADKAAAIGDRHSRVTRV